MTAQTLINLLTKLPLEQEVPLLIDGEEYRMELVSVGDGWWTFKPIPA